MTIDPEILRIVEEVSGCEPGELNSESRLIADAGLTSIDFLDMQFRIERALKFPFPIEDRVPRLRAAHSPGAAFDLTVGELAALIEAERRNRRAS